MPYIVRRGEVRDGEKRYKSGDFVPGSKGSLDDMAEAGAVEWVDAPAREAKPKAAAKRRAVKP